MSQQQMRSWAMERIERYSQNPDLQEMFQLIIRMLDMEVEVQFVD